MAFPTTGVIDNFNRADENPLSDGGKWSNPLNNFAVALKVLTNVAAPTSSSDDAYRNTQTYGPDSEVFITVSTAGGSVNPDKVLLWFRTSNENTGSENGYRLNITFTNTVQFFKRITGVFTQLGADVTRSVASGDALGYEAIGSTLTAYYKASGGSWVSVANRTDSSLTGAGHIGTGLAGLSTSVTRLDDFGGGTVVAAAGAPIAAFDKYFSTLRANADS